MKNSAQKISAFICSLSFIFLFLFNLSVLVFLPTNTFAADNSCSWNKSGGVYCMLAPLGNFVGNQGKIDLSNSNSFAEYLKTLYRMGIIVATGLAVIMITVGGLKYASTDAIDGKNEGKAIIQQSLLGLVLALMSYVLLQQINPALLRATASVNKITVDGKIEDTGGLLSTDSVVAKQTYDNYASKGENPMIDTDGVVYVDDAGNAVHIGGGSVAIDYDGSPGVYRVVEDPNGPYEINGVRYSSVGYENLSNARSNSGNWVGVQTDSNGQPIINSDGTLNQQLSWGNGKINGNTDPFVALSSSQVAAAKQVNPNFGLGDTVYLTSNGKTIEAVYADYAGKRDSNYSEVSPAAAQALGIPFNQRGTLDDNASIQISLPQK